MHIIDVTSDLTGGATAAGVSISTTDGVTPGMLVFSVVSNERNVKFRGNF